MKKLLTLFTLLLTVCSGAWGENAASNPATTTHKVGDNDNQVFLDVANTTSNATITEGSVKCVTYGIYYLCASWKPSWVAGATGNTNNDDLSYTNYTADGFLDTAEGSGTNGEKAATSGYRNLKIRSSSSYDRIFYVTGITGIAILGLDASSTNKVKISVEEVNADGTLGTANNTISKGTTSAHITTYGASLNGLKYYKITITGATTSGDSKVSQIRFTQYIDNRPAAPISWSATSALATIGESNIYPTLTNTSGLTVSYSSSNTDVATINPSTGVITLVAKGLGVI